MKILSCVLDNFASYERLEFDFADQGLTLVQGPTGSGKSTLCDAVPWILFGRTAKDGAVDEVRSWNTGEPTRGRIVVRLRSNESIEVTRVRGTTKDNDLYYSRYDHNIYKPEDILPNNRGKDLADTQRHINQALGFDCDLYLAAAYYHEFSQTAQFFVTTAKVRRAICEQLVDLSLAMKLRLNIAESIKTATKELAAIDTRLTACKGEVCTYHSLISDEQSRSEAWREENAKAIRDVTEKSKNFDEAKRTIVRELSRQAALFKKQKLEEIRTINEAIVSNKADIKTQEYFEFEENRLQEALLLTGSEVCETCGGPKNNEECDKLHARLGELKAERLLSNALSRGIPKLEAQLEQVRTKDNPYLPQIDAEATRENTYGDQLKTLKTLRNPHKETVRQYLVKTYELADVLKALGEAQDSAGLKIDDLEALSDVLDTYRSTTIQHTIQSVENKTNDLLTRFFDAEIRVIFAAGGADKIEVEITKDGNSCAYAQLSKGQRQLLKLCFGVAVMKTVAEKQAAKFEQIFLDEFLDGLDENFKAKAFRLLESLELEYGSVFVVEHSESFKSLFANSYAVSLVNGKSQLAKA